MPASRPASQQQAYAMAYGVSSSWLAFPERVKRARTTLNRMSLTAQVACAYSASTSAEWRNDTPTPAKIIDTIS